MLFLTYWELDESMPVEQRQGIAQKLINAGLFPPENVKIHAWHGTPDGWGVLIAEAETSADITTAINMWRVAGQGFFKLTRTAPAQTIQDALQNQQAVIDRLKSNL